jgi:hypothetical protein
MALLAGAAAGLPCTNILVKCLPSHCEPERQDG